jgi:hypothetical protein
LGINEPKRVTGYETYVEFTGEHAARNAIMVKHQMDAHSMTFAEAIDYLEIRRGYHFKATTKPKEL